MHLQPLQTTPRQSSNLGPANNLASVVTVREVNVEPDELLQVQKDSPRTASPGVNSPRNLHPRPPSLTRPRSEASLRKPSSDSQQAIGVRPATSIDQKSGNGVPPLPHSPVHEEGEQPAQPAKQPAQNNLLMLQKDPGSSSFEDSATQLAGVGAQNSVPNTPPDDGRLFVSRSRPGSQQGQNSHTQQPPSGAAQDEAAAPAAPANGASNPVDGSLAQAAELPKDDDEVHPFVGPEPSSTNVAAEGTDVPASTQAAELQQEAAGDQKSLRSMSSVGSEPDGPREPPSIPKDE
ncbi:hypothetical protein DUNSADRAFT_6746 [Dunaliella salina]|uniref:Encoded protein n=1 Tax=Dunaliella salina TaxID=3046 RepID=A0ABQ7H6L3_DUNSA|nr:hypothetical protein DUNSADRAFT_6746 [Dunaliella salina]|eukprot:KAF5842502.1 hypothetical protein DUNSADRAFT_6746 [Dunaliella salina]